MQGLTTKPRVLVCDEDTVLVGAIGAALEAAGFEARTASDPKAAWVVAQALEPHFALVDISSPRSREMTLARQLARAHVPFGVLSARDDAERVRGAIESGAMGCIFKPLDVAIVAPSIAPWVARACEIRQLRDEKRSLQQAVGQNRSIGTAVGLLMERHGLSLGDAFEALRRQARSERRSVAALASDIVTGVAALRLR
jgi:response regulator NasT